MQKIMFNDRIKLTAAVLEGQKTMTRMVIKCPKNYDDFKVYSELYIGANNGILYLSVLDSNSQRLNYTFCLSEEDLALINAYFQAQEPCNRVKITINIEPIKD